MKNRFNTLAEMQAVLSEDTIVKIVNKFLETRTKQKAYHTQYNERRKLVMSKYAELEKLAKEKGLEIEDLVALQES